MKALRFATAFSVLMLFIPVYAGAQARFDGYFGMGTAQVGSDNQEYMDESTGGLTTTPSMGGVFGTLGGALMFSPSFGVGGQVSFRFAQGDYAGFGYRPIFYDFNGIWTPQINGTVVPEFQAGLGGLNLRFYNPNYTYYDYNTGRYTNFAGSVNHFQLHVAAGLRFKVKPHIFVRPTVDYHWVRNLENPPGFGSDSVFEYTLAVVFSSGE